MKFFGLLCLLCTIGFILGVGVRRSVDEESRTIHIQDCEVTFHDTTKAYISLKCKFTWEDKNNATSKGMMRTFVRNAVIYYLKTEALKIPTNSSWGISSLCDTVSSNIKSLVANELFTIAYIQWI